MLLFQELLALYWIGLEAFFLLIYLADCFPAIWPAAPAVAPRRA